MSGDGFWPSVLDAADGFDEDRGAASPAPRLKRTAPVADVMPDYAALAEVLVAKYTDDEWAARDAAVQDTLECEARASLDIERRLAWDSLVRFGTPRETLRLVTDTDSLDHGKVAMRQLGDLGQNEVLVLSGSTGTGKTVAAVTWLWRHRALPGGFMRASAFAAASSFDGALRTNWAHLWRVMVLDDLGAEYADNKGAFVSRAEEVFDHYVADGRGLVVTTNLSPADILTRYGERLASRLVGRIRPASGEDLRRRRR